MRTLENFWFSLVELLISDKFAGFPILPRFRGDLPRAHQRAARVPHSGKLLHLQRWVFVFYPVNGD